jgi:hypothetical protein
MEAAAAEEAVDAAASPAVDEGQGEAARLAAKAAASAAAAAAASAVAEAAALVAAAAAARFADAASECERLEQCGQELAAAQRALLVAEGKGPTADLSPFRLRCAAQPESLLACCCRTLCLLETTRVLNEHMHECCLSDCLQAG